MTLDKQASSVKISEHSLQTAYTEGRIDDVLTQSVELYGPEVLGFIVSRLHDYDLANDAFAQTCEDLCRSIHDFEWRCSMRTWMYRLARSAVAKQQRRPSRRLEHNIPLSQVSDIANRLRTETENYLRSEIKDGFTKLRDELDGDDQTLLILRVDRDLDWKDVAHVLSEETLDLSEQTRTIARLRKRFQLLKRRLRQRAEQEGLV